MQLEGGGDWVPNIPDVATNEIVRSSARLISYSRYTSYIDQRCDLEEVM